MPPFFKIPPVKCKKYSRKKGFDTGNYTIKITITINSCSPPISIMTFRRRSQQDVERAEKQRRNDKNAQVGSPIIFDHDKGGDDLENTGSDTNRSSSSGRRKNRQSNDSLDSATTTGIVHCQLKVDEATKDDTDNEDCGKATTFTKKRSRSESHMSSSEGFVATAASISADLTDDEGGHDEESSMTSCQPSSGGSGRTSDNKPKLVDADVIQGDDLDIELRRSRRVRRVRTDNNHRSGDDPDERCRYVVFEDLPLEWWERTPGCKEAKASHMAYIDRTMDGLVGHVDQVEMDDGGDDTCASSGSNSKSCSSSSSSSSSTGTTNIHAVEQDEETFRDGRERLVLLTTLAHHDTVLEANLFPYACPEGIEHFTLWSIHELTKIEIQDYVDHWVLRHLPPRGLYRWQYDDNAGERSILLFHVHVFVETRLSWDCGSVWELSDGLSSNSGSGAMSSSSGSCNSNSSSSSSSNSSSSSSSTRANDDDLSSNTASLLAAETVQQELLPPSPPPSPPSPAPKRAHVLLPPFVPRVGLEYFPPHTIVYQQPPPTQR